MALPKGRHSLSIEQSIYDHAAINRIRKANSSSRETNCHCFPALSGVSDAVRLYKIDSIGVAGVVCGLKGRGDDVFFIAFIEDFFFKDDLVDLGVGGWITCEVVQVPPGVSLVIRDRPDLPMSMIS